MIGGVFGYVRCSSGPAFGYFVGMLELLQNIAFMAAVANIVSDVIIKAMNRLPAKISCYKSNL